MNIDDALKDIIKDLKEKKEKMTKKHNQFIDLENDLREKIANASRLLADNKKKELQPVPDEVLIKKQKTQNDNLKIQFTMQFLTLPNPL